MSIADAPAEVAWPTHLDLPETDGKPVENAFEHPQSALLSDVLLPVLDRLHPDGNYFVGADTGIYWYHSQPNPLDGCKSPDWYYVPNVPRLLDGELRRSYVQWVEKTDPLLVVEYVSGGGAEEHDATPITGKFWVYERAICAPYYIIWDPPRGRIEGYELVRGRYRSLAPDAHGRVRVGDMDVGFGVWHGTYHGYTTDWLRAWDREGNLLPTADERAEAIRQTIEDAQRRAEAEYQRAEKLAARLRELGVDPDSL